MATRKIPWKGLDAPQVIIAVTQKNTRLNIPRDCDRVFRKIITSVWNSAPEKRYKDARECLSKHFDISG
jgi:hypothetical protein